MDFCCPDPEHPVIVPDRESLALRRKLRYVVYGMFYVCFAKFII